MIENEDSVVTSLNELRKLKHERITRQSQSRSFASAGRAVALAEDPAQDQMTPPPVHAVPTAVHQPAPQPFAVQSFAQASPAAFAPMHFDPNPMPAPTIVKTKTSFKAAAAVAVVLMGAAGAGYVKLQGETQAKLLAKDVAVQQAEEARNRAVELAAKADVQAKTTLRQCEDKLKASTASAAPAAPAPAAAAAVAPVVDKPEKPAKIAQPSRKAARPARHVAAAPAPAAKPAKASSGSADVPTIAKKKKLDNDPLAGLGKL